MCAVFFFFFSSYMQPYNETPIMYSMWERLSTKFWRVSVGVYWPVSQKIIWDCSPLLAVRVLFHPKGIQKNWHQSFVQDTSRVNKKKKIVHSNSTYWNRKLAFPEIPQDWKWIISQKFVFFYLFFSPMVIVADCISFGDECHPNSCSVLCSNHRQKCEWSLGML